MKKCQRNCIVGLFIYLSLYIGVVVADDIEIGECFNNKIGNPGFPFLQNGVGKISWKVWSEPSGQRYAKWLIKDRVSGTIEYAANRFQFNDKRELDNFKGRIVPQNDISYFVVIKPRTAIDKLITFEFAPTDAKVDNSDKVISDSSVCAVTTFVPVKKSGDKVDFMPQVKYYASKSKFEALNKQYDTGTLWSYKCVATKEDRLRIADPALDYGILNLDPQKLVWWEADVNENPQNLSVSDTLLVKRGSLNSSLFSERAALTYTFNVLYSNIYASEVQGAKLTDIWKLTFTGGTTWSLDIIRDTKSRAKSTSINNIKLVCAIYKSGEEDSYNQPPEPLEPSVVMHMNNLRTGEAKDPKK